MRVEPGFWDVDERYVRSEAGDPLEKRRGRFSSSRYRRR